MRSGVVAEKQLHVILNRSNAGDSEVLHENLGHIGAEEGGQSGAQVDVLDAQIQQGQQTMTAFVVPGDVVDNGQVVDVVQAENFLELQGDNRQGVGVVALTGVQHAGNAADVAQRKLVIFILGAAGGEDDRVLRQSLGKLGVVFTALGPAVTAGHDHKLPDGAALDGIHHLVSQSEDLLVGEAADDLSGLDLRGSGALLGVLDNGGEVLLLADLAGDVLAAGIAGGSGGVQAVLIALLGGVRYSWWSSGWGR